MNIEYIKPFLTPEQLQLVESDLDKAKEVIGESYLTFLSKLPQSDGMLVMLKVLGNQLNELDQLTQPLSSPKLVYSPALTNRFNDQTVNNKITVNGKVQKIINEISNHEYRIIQKVIDLGVKRLTSYETDRFTEQGILNVVEFKNHCWVVGGVRYFDYFFVEDKPVLAKTLFELYRNL